MKRYLLFVAVSAAISLDVMGQGDPSLSMKITNCLNKPLEGSAVCTVSNLERIEVDIVLDPNGNENLVDMEKVTVNPTEAPTTPYFVIRAVDDRTGEQAPVKVTVSAADVENKKDLLNVLVEVPESAEVRKKKIQECVNRIKARDLASGAASQKTIDEASKKNDEIVSALDYYYLENRVGRFKILVEFHSQNAAGWSGVVKSTETPVDIVNKGSGLDVLEKK